jgi:hypothetical protein
MKVIVPFSAKPRPNGLQTARYAIETRDERALEARPPRSGRTHWTACLQSASGSSGSTRGRRELGADVRTGLVCDWEVLIAPSV